MLKDTPFHTLVSHSQDNRRVQQCAQFVSHIPTLLLQPLLFRKSFYKNTAKESASLESVPIIYNWTTVSLLLLWNYELSWNMSVKNSSSEFVTECSDDERNEIGKQRMSLVPSQKLSLLWWESTILKTKRSWESWQTHIGRFCRSVERNNQFTYSALERTPTEKVWRKRRCVPPKPCCFAVRATHKHWK